MSFELQARQVSTGLRVVECLDLRLRVFQHSHSDLAGRGSVRLGVSVSGF